MRRLTACFDHQTPPPTSLGAMRTSFTIGPSGAVTAVAITGIDPKLAACLERVMRTMQFPAPSDGGSVVVSYPFNVDPFSD